MSTNQIDLCNVCVLTVTYGDRLHLLSGMIQSVMDQGVRQVLIFANGLTRNVRERLEQLLKKYEGLDAKLQISEDNVGPAIAYASLLRKAAASSAIEAVLLMDDDNRLQDGCLARLLQASGGEKAACGVRTDRRYIVEAAEKGAMLPPANGEAFGFDLRKRPKRILSKLFGRRPARAASLVAVPLAPYGGLLVPRIGLDTVSGPREAFSIYADDYEYTQRLARQIGLFLVPGANVDDQEMSWNATRKTQPRIGTAARLAVSLPDFRVYYALRNALVLDRERTQGIGLLWFAVNLGLLIGLAVGHALIRGRLANVRVVLLAARDAMTNTLGPSPKYPLP